MNLREEFVKFLKCHSKGEAQVLMYQAWLCPNCHTINGFNDKTMNLRKLCRKCKRFRSVKYTIADYLKVLK